MRLGKIRMRASFCAVILLALSANPAAPRKPLAPACKGAATYVPGACPVGCSETGSASAFNDPTCETGCAIDWTWTETCPQGQLSGGGSDTLACGTPSARRESACGHFEFGCKACP